MFEKAKESTGKAVGRMLGRLEKRVENKKLDQSAAEQAIETVAEGIVQAKAVLDSDFDFDTASAAEVAGITNAWTAWGRDGVLKGDALKPLRGKLQKLLSDGDEEAPANAKRYARQIWRTEMASYIAEKLSASGRADKADIMEKVMAAQIVGEKENDPMEALTGAMWLDSKITSKAVRTALAKQMEASHNSCSHTKISEVFLGISVTKTRVVTGGEFLVIEPELAQKFAYQRMVYVKEENRIYAQMENGCRGNLVIIDVVPERPPVKPPPPPVKPPTPGPSGGGPGKPRVKEPPPVKQPPPGPSGGGPGKPKIPKTGPSGGGPGKPRVNEPPPVRPGPSGGGPGKPDSPRQGPAGGGPRRPIEKADRKGRGGPIDGMGPEKPRGSLDISRDEERRLASYYGSQYGRSEKVFQRTFADRHRDQVDFLKEQDVFPEGSPAPVFIDIGPGLSNTDAPAITSAEMADSIPKMKVVALDLPESVQDFQKNVPRAKREALLARPNVSIVAGDGLKPLRAQVEPVIGQIPSGTPIILRAANSIDIYCEWKDVEPALRGMAADFRDHPALMFFNREIMYKKAGSTTWSIVGQVSNRGFNHSNRELTRRGPPYRLKTEYATKFEKGRDRIS